MSSPSDLEMGAIPARADGGPRGFHQLARFMSITQYGVFKKFDYLALLNILYLQSELWHLTAKLERQIGRDAAAGGRRSQFELSWIILSSSAALGDDSQWRIMLEIRKKLTEYYDAILQYSEVSNLRRPSESQRQFLSDWIASESLNSGSCSLMSREFMGENGPAVLADDQRDDLMLLSASEEENDLLARYLVAPLFRVIRPFWEPKGRGGIVRSHMSFYPPDMFKAMNHVIGAIFSAATPLLSILVLYFVQGQSLKVGLVCLFTILFSLALSLLSKCRRIEIFAATTAFSAILVVFISGTNVVEV